MGEISDVSPWHPFAHTTAQTHLTTSGAARHTVILALGRKWQKNQEFKVLFSYRVSVRHPKLHKMWSSKNQRKAGEMAC